MSYLRPLVLLALLLAVVGTASAQKISKQTLVSQGSKRTYYLFVPENVKGPAPLLLAFHGTGRNGLSLLEKWKDLAAREGFIVAGPDSKSSQTWKTPEDGPDFLRDLVEELKSKYPINARRVYMFGHSGGAGFALGMSMFESKYFAATAIHAGSWRDPNEYRLAEHAKRKIPLAIMVGDRDPFFPVSSVTATSELLKGKGFEVEVTVLKGHDHWYYDKAPKINEQLWDFLKRHELAEEPEFEQYLFKK
ncbi:MAG TPA: dienelactone hydrolase family protein [Pyrinomonadaceae bacterium]|nr:dienelactone hydrolase family protein [Pyrinomonadaceae bacterium]